MKKLVLVVSLFVFGVSCSNTDSPSTKMELESILGETSAPTLIHSMVERCKKFDELMNCELWETYGLGVLALEGEEANIVQLRTKDQMKSEPLALIWNLSNEEIDASLTDCQCVYETWVGEELFRTNPALSIPINFYGIYLTLDNFESNTLDVKLTNQVDSIITTNCRIHEATEEVTANFEMRGGNDHIDLSYSDVSGLVKILGGSGSDTIFCALGNNVVYGDNEFKDGSGRGSVDYMKCYYGDDHITDYSGVSTTVVAGLGVDLIFIDQDVSDGVIQGGDCYETLGIWHCNYDPSDAFDSAIAYCNVSSLCGDGQGEYEGFLNMQEQTYCSGCE